MILISYSGQTKELNNIIQFANRNKILLIGIISKKNSTLYKAADIKLLIPQVIEAAGIIPTSSTTTQLALGDALAISAMRERNLIDSLLETSSSWKSWCSTKTVEDLMLTRKKYSLCK